MWLKNEGVRYKHLTKSKSQLRCNHPSMLFIHILYNRHIFFFSTSKPSPLRSMHGYLDVKYSTQINYCISPCRCGMSYYFLTACVSWLIAEMWLQRSLVVCMSMLLLSVPYSSSFVLLFFSVSIIKSCLERYFACLDSRNGCYGKINFLPFRVRNVFDVLLR